MSTIGIGIVGAGFVADLHASVYAELQGLDVAVVGVTSRTQSKTEEYARKYAIPKILPDLDGLLALDEVDIVDICTPNQLHRDFVVRAAQAGKHIICEKPLTGYFGKGEEAVGKTNRGEMLAEALANADLMLQAAAKSGVKLMYAENWLYSPVIQRAKRLIQSCAGTILEVRGEESHHGSHSAFAKSWRNTGGGSLIRLGAHPIAGILHLKACEGIWRDGQPIRARSVMADVTNLTEIESFKQKPGDWIVRDWEDVENWATAIITFSDGAKGIISASDICLGGMKDTLDIFLSNARIHCDFSRNTLLQAYAPDALSFQNEYLNEKLESKAGWSFPSVDEGWLFGYHQELREFVEAVKYDREALSTGQLGRDVVEIIYSAYLSAAEGRPVQL